MGNWSKFQLILTGVFAFAILAGVATFAVFRGAGSSAQSVLVWGTIPVASFGQAYSGSALARDKTIVYSYVQKSPDTFSEEFVDALATGVGPDLILVPHELILKDKNKLYVLPWSSYSERQFRDTFVDGAEIFFVENGSIGIPAAVDPLILFWNRDILSQAGVASPPTLWSQFFDLSQKITVRDQAYNITRSVAPLGEYRNVKNAKEFITTLLMQAGNPLVEIANGTYRSIISESVGKTVAPAESALTFYTEFSNPAKSFYSWNRSLPNSELAFLSGDLAFYFGFAGEINTIKLKNPNLNFDVAPLPQSQSGERNTTFGRFYTFATNRNSRSLAGAYRIAYALSASPTLAQSLGIAPATRLAVSAPPADAFSPVTYKSALWARSWLDPDDKKSSLIFQDMIEAITSGRQRMQEAVRRADSELDILFSKW